MALIQLIIGKHCMFLNMATACVVLTYFGLQHENALGGKKLKKEVGFPYY